MAAAEKIVREHTETQLAQVLAKSDAHISEYGLVAEALDVPLWLLFIPGLNDHPELLDAEGMERLRALVENYIASSDEQRRGIDVLAQHYAGPARA